MSRIGKKPIALPTGVKYTVSENGHSVLVEGPKGKVNALLPGGITLVQKDGHLVTERQNDKQAAFHGLARALVFNAVTGVTTGWTKDIDIVGIGYRAEMKGKLTVVFSLGYSHPIEYPLPTGVDAAVDPKQTRITLTGIDRQKVGQVAADGRDAGAPPHRCSAAGQLLQNSALWPPGSEANLARQKHGHQQRTKTAHCLQQHHRRKPAAKEEGRDSDRDGECLAGNCDGRVEIHAAFYLTDDAVPQHVDWQRVKLDRHVAPFGDERSAPGIRSLRKIRRQLKALHVVKTEQ